MNDDLQILNLRNDKDEEESTPEQYAITVLGGESLKAAKALVKKSEQAIKAAIVPEARDSKWHMHY